ncbi:glycosyltransferase [Tahibacter amnicola]|uniref:Glycosyltransferase n=1 Tax=Tahibacter amnicola TaxID=2976241 RepID=A0ABY6BEU5_9GAMM|nr:glycosyltransferase [Tahibacter amnicola]UXI67136.1 glycosyltransferase [Tahibacter amnicola]
MIAGEEACRIAVLIPCYNEAVAIARVVADFRTALPEAQIHVFDNNSRDGSAAIARAAGAQVCSVGLQGKGHVVRRMFADVDADIYIMVDGDDTYDAASAPALVRRLRQDQLDMVVAVREPVHADVHRPGHAFGNRLLSGFLSRLFGRPCADILSGYRVFSRRFAKSFPVLSAGFEIETELSVHALELKMAVSEVVTPFKERPEGSHSKLSTVRDGLRIVSTMGRLFAAERPLVFYSILAAMQAVLAIVLAVPLFITYAQTGLVPRFPTAILATGIMVFAALSFFAGLILDTVTRGRRELKMLSYLAQPAPPRLGDMDVPAVARPLGDLSRDAVSVMP